MLCCRQKIAVFLSGCTGPLVAAAAEPVFDSADRPVSGSTLSAAPDPVSMASLWQLTLGLLLVLTLIVAIAWLLKRSGRFQIAAGGGLRILGGLSMGARERVVLLQVGDTQLLVGVAPGRVQTLHVLEEPLAGAASAPHNAARFADQLGRLLNKEAAS
jgi:flagellar protein FliO/FliZ